MMATIVSCAALAWQPRAVLPAAPRAAAMDVKWAPCPLLATRGAPRAVLIASEGGPPMSRADELAAKEASRQALEAANAKLEALNEVGKAPTSWADLGLPSKPPEPPAVPAILSAAPLVLGGFSVLLFTLNALGLFGDGPDLDKLVEEWSQL